MKKLIVLSSIIALTSSAYAAGNSSSYEAAGSSSSGSSTSLRILGGLGLSRISNENTERVKQFGVEASSRKGLNLGLELDFPLSETFSFSTGANYIQKGISYTQNQSAQGIVVDLKYNINLNYIEIPAMINGNLHIGDSTLGLGVGPYLAFAVSKSASMSAILNGVEQMSAEESKKLNDDAAKEIRDTDLGGRASFRFTTPISSDLSFVAGANYDLGFSNIATDEEAEAITKTRSFTANVGLGIKL